MKIIQRNDEYKLIGKRFVGSGSSRVYTLIGYAKKKDINIMTVILAHKSEHESFNPSISKSDFIEMMAMNGFQTLKLADGYEDFSYDFYSQYVFDNYFIEVK